MITEEKKKLVTCFSVAAFKVAVNGAACSEVRNDYSRLTRQVQPPAGCTGFEEMEDVERGSKANPGEAKLVIAYVERMLNCGLMEKDIAIITPYNGQVNLLRSVLLDAYPSVEVRSVDGFQGREKVCI